MSPGMKFRVAGPHFLIQEKGFAPNCSYIYSTRLGPHVSPKPGSHLNKILAKTSKTKIEADTVAVPRQLQIQGS
jgi:hypothetical protein